MRLSPQQVPATILLLLLLLLLVHDATSQTTTHLVNIDNQLQKFARSLDFEELTLESTLEGAAKTAAQAAAETHALLQPSRMSQQQSLANVTGTLDDLAQHLDDISDTYQYRRYARLDSCANVTGKLADIAFNVRDYAQTRVQMAADAQLLSALHAHLLFQTQTQGRPLPAKITTSIDGVLGAAKRALTELRTYDRLLADGVRIKTALAANISAIAQTTCVYGKFLPEERASSMAIAIFENVQYVEEPLGVAQTEIDGAAARALDKTQVIMSGTSAGSALSLLVARVRNFLGALRSAHEYPSVEREDIKTCADLVQRVGYVRFRQRRYDDVKDACERNLTKAATFASALGDLKSVSAVRAVKELVGGLEVVREALEKYKSLLIASGAHFASVVTDVQAFSDFYCTMQRAPKTTTTKAYAGGRGYPCALWTKYMNDSAPETNGFKFGLSVNRTNGYVAKVKYIGFMFPGRIELNVGPFYRSYSLEWPVDYAEYLVVREGCDCFWHEPAPWKLPPVGLIKFQNMGKEVAIGRVTFSDETSIVTMVETSTYQHMYMDQNFAFFLVNASEVLACESGSVDSLKDVPILGPSCAHWAAYNADDEPKRFGFEVGRSIRKTTAYVGRGYYNMQSLAGRIQVVPSYGVFLAWTTELLGGEAEYLYVPAGCGCRFRDIAYALRRDGLVHTPNGQLIGRVNFTGNYVAVTRIDLQFNSQYYVGLGDKLLSDPPDNALVCEPEAAATTTKKPLSTTTEAAITGDGYPCAMWMRYNNDTAPQAIGFSAGTSVDGTPAYVARSTTFTFHTPARISIKGDDGYVVATALDEMVVREGDFLVKRAGCTCDFLEPNAESPQKGLVFVGDSSVRVAIGRRHTPIGQVVLTAVNMPHFQHMYFSAGRRFVVEFAAEVLVCESQDRGEAPVVRFGTKACGLWSEFGNWSMPQINGFYAGKSVKDSMAYVATAFMENESKASWLQLESPSGVYVGENGDEAGDYPEYLVLARGCRCFFLDVGKAVKRDGLMATQNSYLIGRKDLGDGYVAVSWFSTYDRDLKQTYVNRTFFDAVDRATEALVCELP